MTIELTPLQPLEGRVVLVAERHGWRVEQENGGIALGESINIPAAATKPADAPPRPAQEKARALHSKSGSSRSKTANYEPYALATAPLRPSVPFTGWPTEVTPHDIARALEISEKTLRAWLRRNPHVIHAHGERWIVTSDEADRIVAAYRASRR